VTAIATQAAIEASSSTWAPVLAALAVLALLAFVFERALADAAGAPLRRLARGLMVVICPLGVVFVVVAATRLASMIQAQLAGP